MKKKVVRKVVGVLLIACVYFPIIAYGIWKNGLFSNFISLLSCLAVTTILYLGVRLLCRPDSKENEPEKENYYTRAVQEIMQGIKNEKILRCIYIFAKDIENEIKEDAKGHEQK